MSTLAVVGGLMAAVFWGSQPVVAKRGLSFGGSPMEVTTVVASTGLVSLWVTLAVIRGPANVVPDLTPAGYGVFLLGGFVGSGIGRLANYSGVNRVGASVNSTIVATNPLFATGLALVFLGELITPTQGLGVIVVVAGLATVTVAKGGDLRGWTYGDLLFSVAAALAYGSGNVFRRYGLSTTAATPLEGVALNETAAFAGIVGYLVFRPGPIVPRIPLRAAGYFVVSGLLGVLGVVMVFVGLNNGPVAIVVTLAGTSTLVANALSYAVLGDLERVTRGIAIGAALVVVGVALIAFP